jgi:DNA-binding transcriptional regulator GbsR (MarR family)
MIISVISVYTEMSDETSIKLSPAAERFILHWGEMGTSWGINRTVAQIHALLYLTPRPLHAEQIASTLSVARSNVSNSLRELQGWGIVRVTHVLGDRRDHFESLKDVWEMFRIITEERKRREVDPTLAMLRECSTETEGANAHEQERIRQMLVFFESMTGAFEELSRVPPTVLQQLVRVRGAFRRVLKGLTK